jgi:hypothetical protein
VLSHLLFLTSWLEIIEIICHPYSLRRTPQ